MYITTNRTLELLEDFLRQHTQSPQETFALLCIMLVRLTSDEYTSEPIDKERLIDTIAKTIHSVERVKETSH